jgi:predicted RNA-binding Zn-ribbon protein involved in translation (DUF1610 family)
VSYGIKLDNEVVSADYTYTMDLPSVIIVVTNRIQGYNTTLPDGDSREILEEVVTYTVKDGKVSIAVTFTALEDLHIELYYGIQLLMNQLYSHLNYNHDDAGFFAVADSSNSGLNHVNTLVDGAYLYSSTNDRCKLLLDRAFGLASVVTTNAVNKQVLFAVGSKMYAWLISGNLALASGAALSWRGSIEYYYHGYGKTGTFHCPKCGTDSSVANMPDSQIFTCPTCGQQTPYETSGISPHFDCPICGAAVSVPSPYVEAE